MSNDFEFQRRSIRLKGYDYSQSGMYFVTICTQERESIFGEIVDGAMVVNDVGSMVKNIWCEIPQHFRNIGIDEYQIMPDHFHGIIVINEMPNPIPNIFQNSVGAGSSRPSPSSPRPDTSLRGGQENGIKRGQENPAPTLGTIIGRFKYETTRTFNDGNQVIKKLWQRNYFEHIIRDDVDLYFVREYIVNNPLAKIILDGSD